MQVLVLPYPFRSHQSPHWMFYYSITPEQLANNLMRDLDIYGFHVIGSNQVFLRDAKNQWYQVTNWSNKII